MCRMGTLARPDFVDPVLSRKQPDGQECPSYGESFILRRVIYAATGCGTGASTGVTVATMSPAAVTSAAVTSATSAA